MKKYIEVVRPLKYARIEIPLLKHYRLDFMFYLVKLVKVDRNIAYGKRRRKK